MVADTATGPVAPAGINAGREAVDQRRGVPAVSITIFSTAGAPSASPSFSTRPTAAAVTTSGPPVDDELAELVAVGHRLSALQRPVDVQVDPEFRVGLRAHARRHRRAGRHRRDRATAEATIDLEAFRAAARPAPGRPATRAGSAPAGAIIVGVAAGAIAVSGMSAASENAVPGDALYGVKRSTERAQLALASSDLSRGPAVPRLRPDPARRGRSARRRRRAASPASLDDMDADTRAGRPAADHRGDPAARPGRPRRDRRRSSTDQRAAVGDMLDRVDRRRAGAGQRLAGRCSTGSSSAVADAARRADVRRRRVAGADALGPLPCACATAGAATTDSGPADTPAQEQGKAPGEVRPGPQAGRRRQRPSTTQTQPNGRRRDRTRRRPSRPTRRRPTAKVAWSTTSASCSAACSTRRFAPSTEALFLPLRRREGRLDR